MRENSEYAYNINVSLYGDCFTSENWALDFLSFAERLQERLDLRYSDFGCAYFEVGKQDTASKSLRYAKRNVERIHSLLMNLDLYSVNLLAAETGADLTRDAECDIGLSRSHPSPSVCKPYHHFFLQVVPEVLVPVAQRDGLFAFFETLLREVENVMNIRYGLFQPMSSEKRGGLYFANIFTEHLSQAERLNLHLWLRSNQEYHRKVRGAYWGNLLTRDHLGRRAKDILAEIEHVVGERNVVEFVEGRYLVAVPTDILRFPATEGEISVFLRAIENILSKYDLLMR